LFLSFFLLPMEHQVTPKKILDVRFLGSFYVLYQGGVLLAIEHKNIPAKSKCIDYNMEMRQKSHKF
jgi:hypothetical protein